MGILSFIFGRKPTIVQDSFFGRMLLMEHRKNKALSYFECYREFAPTNSLVEICLYGSEGASEKQKHFFKEIENSYDSLSVSIIATIEDEFRNWKDDFKIIDFKKEFAPNFLVIPSCEKLPLIWEISFLSIHDENHQFTVRMRDDEAFEIDIDG